ncbi:YbfB/YjiJ family MFS transporter [Micromonospora rubida]|uniref:YbfB/YjiJ family MFS transporter n=1 Tax=Micromonospora rubida TaxID=2697657 RepID=UPI0013765B6E|nr:YbfB/YjiJ family MFS transporter [Micromonospora rubida]NBE81788.1 YbfB/YjiJ family MFS transporter [Micromonospora rubida]
MRSPVLRQGVWQAARLALGTAAALGLARFAYGLLLPAMRDDLHWSLAEAGAMSTANGVGYLVGALVTAPVVRRVGTAAFRWGMALTAVALAATAIGDDFLTLVLARAAAGAAGAVVFVTGGVIASRIAARVASSVPITVYFAGTGLGIVLSGATIPALGDHWRLAWVALGVAAGAATLVSWAAAGTKQDAPARTAGRARVRPLWGIALAYLLFATGYITYITFLSAYLADRHAPIAQVVLTWTALGLAVVAAPALWSRPTTHWSGTRALATLLGVLAGGAALALVAPTPPVILASAIVYGATFMGVPAAVTALIRANTPPTDWTATLAAFTMLFAVGQTAGPWIAGIVADHTSTDATVAWTAVLCAVAAGIAATAGRFRTPTTTTERDPASPRQPPEVRVP